MVANDPARHPPPVERNPHKRAHLDPVGESVGYRVVEEPLHRRNIDQNPYNPHHRCTGTGTCTCTCTGHRVTRETARHSHERGGPAGYAGVGDACPPVPSRRGPAGYAGGS